MPLFTTCSLLANAGGNIRHAAVSSALNQLGDLGGSRIADALQAFFTERNKPTLLVIDSLDEARNPDGRLRQAGTLPWRIILTSRPRSWNQQLAMDQADDAHRVGSLRPLRYPDDVESFIARWFTQRPSWGEELTAQIARRPDLQQAATVPLILAFCCIIGGDHPLPATRRELNALVLRRILTGLWRGHEERQSDPEICYATLRDWAWAGATCDPISGIGTWSDEIPVHRVYLNDSDQAAVDHVAMPLGLENLDTGITLRRFIHRSIREHLTAEHVALRLSAGPAAMELMNHLWYDADWESVAPAALAMHPQRDQVLQEVLCRVAHSEQIPQDLALIDGCRELRRFLARVATESSESDWTSESATIISRARLDLAAEGFFGDIRAAPGWENSDRPIRQLLSAQLARENNGRRMRDLARALAGLAPGTVEREQAGQALVALLARESDPWKVRDLARALAGLAPGTVEREQAGQALVALLARESDPWTARDLTRTLIRLDPGKRQQAGRVLLALLAREGDVQFAGILAWALADLGPDERKLARQALIARLAWLDDAYDACDLARTLAGLNPDPDEREKIGEVLLILLARQRDPWRAKAVARTLAGLDPDPDPDPDEREKAGQVLRAVMPRQRDPWETQDPWETLAGLSPDEQERVRHALLVLITPPLDKSRERRSVSNRLARIFPSSPEQSVLVGLLTRQSDMRFDGELARMLARMGPDLRQRLLYLMARPDDPREAWDMARTRAKLRPDPAELANVSRILTAMLARESDTKFARDLAKTLAELNPGLDQRAQARRLLMARLARQDDSRKVRELAEALAALEADPDPDERTKAGQVLLARLARQDDPWKVQDLVVALDVLDPDNRGQAVQAVLALLARESQAHFVSVLLQTLAKLDLGPYERAHARQVLLDRLARRAGPLEARELAEALAGLDLDPDEREKAGQVLVTLLARQSDPSKACNIAEALTRLEPDSAERALAAQALVALLTRENDAQSARMLAEALAELGPDERKLARQALLALLARKTDPWQARDVALALAGLNPDPDERTQAIQAMATLLARQADPWKAQELALALAGLNPDPDERTQAIQAMAALLAREKDRQYTRILAETLAGLSRTEGKLAREALEAVLAREANPQLAETVMGLLARLGPDARVLENWRSWALPPSRNLMAVARRNSPLSCWLEALPSLGGLPA